MTDTMIVILAGLIVASCGNSDRGRLLGCVVLAGLIVASCGNSDRGRLLGRVVATVCGAILLATLIAGMVFGIGGT